MTCSRPRPSTKINCRNQIWVFYSPLWLQSYHFVGAGYEAIEYPISECGDGMWRLPCQSSYKSRNVPPGMLLLQDFAVTLLRRWRGNGIFIEFRAIIRRFMAVFLNVKNASLSLLRSHHFAWMDFSVAVDCAKPP